MRVAFGPFTFDSDTRELLEGGQRVHVSPKAFDLLQLLLERRPKVVTKTELHDRVWTGVFVGDATLSVAIAELRAALGDDSREGRWIRTVHRVGYAFAGEAVDLAEPEPRPRFDWRCWLVWNDRRFPLPDGEHIVGRDPRCDIWLDASGVSRRHARITVAGERAEIEDLGSRNGTWVAGRRLRSSRTLNDGDALELGAASLSFRSWSDDRAPETVRLKRRG